MLLIRRRSEPILPKSGATGLPDLPGTWDTTFRSAFVKHKVTPYVPAEKPEGSFTAFST